MSVHFCSPTVQFDCSATAHTAELPRKAVVGYSTIEIPTGYSMFTPVFDKVGGTTFTLGDITVCNANGDEFNDVDVAEGGTGKVPSGKLKVRKLKAGSIIDPSTEWAYQSLNYYRRDTAQNAWGWRTNRTQPLDSGEGIIVYNGLDSAIKFRVAGEVVLKPQMNIPMGYSVFGNNTPVDLTLGDITVCNANGDEFNDVDVAEGGTGKVPSGKLKVRKLKAGSIIDPSTEWAYQSLNYYRRDTAQNAWGWRTNRTQPLKAGEALIIYNGLDDEIIFKMKSPLPETK